MSDRSDLPQAVYELRCARYGALRDQQAQRSRRNGDLNLFLFFVALIVVGVALWRAEPLLFVAAGVAVVAFIGSVVSHGRIKRQLEQYTTLYNLNSEGLHRLKRAWDNLPTPPLANTPSGEELAALGEQAAAIDVGAVADLDLLGKASLEQLLGTPNTPVGWTTLRRWILAPAAPAEVRLRQAAVAELAALVDWREEVGLRGRLLSAAGASQPAYERFVGWAESPNWLHQHRWLMWLARILPLIVIGLGLAAWYNYPVYLPLAAMLAVNLAVTMTIGQRVSETISQVAAHQAVYQAYAELFALATRQPFTADALQRLQTQLAASGLPADAQMRRLARLMPLADIRRSIYFFPIEIVTLWSFHLLWLLEGWQREAGAQVRGWLAALGEVEALIALATLKHDEPDWCLPAVTEHASAMLQADALAHPLLPTARAVGNPVQVGPPGTFLLVTGSNMSGKSTLLRAIGVNTVLAQMGAPVHAAALQLTPLRVTSSMRVQDSLAQGVSFFMAELRRLKAVVDLAEVQQARGDRPLLYLLDEILQGTNTHERQIAARQIILHLIRAGAIGAVSTHDLTLADAPELAAASVPVYFTEQFTRGPEGPAMHFDYQLRPGIATSTNALKLMELVGLAVDDPAPATTPGA